MQLREIMTRDPVVIGPAACPSRGQRIVHDRKRGVQMTVGYMFRELVGRVDNLVWDSPALGPDVLDAIDDGRVLERHGQEALLARLRIRIPTLQHEHAAYRGSRRRGKRASQHAAGVPL